MLPPGRDIKSTKPPPTGSATAANTIGTVRVTRCNSATRQTSHWPGLPPATAQPIAPQIPVSARHRPDSSGYQYGCCWPSLQPNSLQSLLQGNQPGLAFGIGGNPAHQHAYPARTLRLLCTREIRRCNGRPSSAMKWRRHICSPCGPGLPAQEDIIFWEKRIPIRVKTTSSRGALAHVRYGSKSVGAPKPHFRSTPRNGHQRTDPACPFR